MNKPLQIGGWAYAALFTVLISACFSPLGYTGPGNPTAGAGTGALSISFSDAAAAPRKMLDADPSALAYELTFMGPGSQTIVRNASWGQTITVRVTPGVWNVSVMATDPKNTAAGIAAVGEAYNIDVKSGANSDVPVKMGVYSEISGFQELAQLLQDTTTGQDDPYDQFIVLTDSFDMGYSLYITGGESVITNPTGGSEIKSSPKTITIAAVNDVNMNYLNDDSSALFYISGGGKLVFGSASPRFPGNITLNGMYNTGISTSPDGGFVMNNGSLINFSYGVSNEGSFIMNGGTISGGSFGIYNNGDLSINGGDITANDIGIQNYNNIRMSGGSIYGNNDGIENRTQAITDTGITTQRTLSMSGGSISDNSGEGIVFISEKYFNDVYIPMVFYMSGGTITGNNNGINYYSSYSPDNSPDDAATDSDTLIMSGGTVTGNIGNNGNIGYDVYNPGAFTISGAAVAERIYLTGASLNISGALSGNFKSTIFLNPFDTEKQILTGNLSRETRDKFRAADASSSDPSNFASITYPFDSQGKLTLPAETWAQTISLIQGDSGNDTPGAVFNAVALDSAGNMYAAGSQNGNYYYSYGSESTYAGGASTNGVLVKYNSKGQAQWQQLMGAGYYDAGFVGVTVDNSDNVIAAGKMSESESAYISIIKYSPDGKILWETDADKSGTGGYAYATGVTTDSQGNIYVTGYCSGEIVFGPDVAIRSSDYGGGDEISWAFLAKYNSSGSAQWVQIAWMDTYGDIQFTAAATDAQGNCYITGYADSANQIYFRAGNTIKTFNIPTSTYYSGNYYYYPTYNPAFIAKYNPNGVLQWAQIVSSEQIVSNNLPPASSKYSAVAVYGNAVYAAGYISSLDTHTFSRGLKLSPYSRDSGNLLPVIVKYNSADGTALAAKSASGNGPCEFIGITADASGVYASGYQSGAYPYVYDGGVSLKGVSNGEDNMENSIIIRYDLNLANTLNGMIPKYADFSSRLAALHSDGAYLYAAGYQLAYPQYSSGSDYGTGLLGLPYYPDSNSLGAYELPVLLKLGAQTLK